MAADSQPPKNRGLLIALVTGVFVLVAVGAAAANQLTSGVRVPAKIVPAVTDVSDRHTAQRRNPSSICHQPPSTASRTGT